MYIINMSTLHFEWDENKNAANIEKHGVSFEEAASVPRSVYLAESLPVPSG